jgi:hypothetical protein
MTPITAADLLNDRVVPFLDEKEVKLSRVLTDRGRLLVSRAGSVSDEAGRLARRINQKKQAILRGHFVATNTRLKRRLGMYVRDDF